METTSSDGVLDEADFSATPFEASVNGIVFNQDIERFQVENGIYLHPDPSEGYIDLIAKNEGGEEIDITKRYSVDFFHYDGKTYLPASN